MRLVRMAAAALAGITLLAGCSDSGGANETLPSTSSTAAETSASLPPLGPPDLPMPAQAREQTPEGVRAFAKYYIELINIASSDLDATYLRSLSRDCDTCNRIADDAEDDRAAGYIYQGGALTITSIGDGALTAEGGEVAFVVDQAPLSVLDPAGQPVEDLTSPQLTDLPAGLSTVWDGDHWLVSSLSFG